MSPPPPAVRELTLSAVLLGVGLSVVLGAANIYLGLKAGMTVSASIPAAVMAMGIYRVLRRRRAILEANLVQTGASAGESLAAGIAFTAPALVLVGVWQSFDYWTTTLIALSGGLLGVLLMIPMRRVFVLGRPELAYPEGVACAEVLRAGEAATGHDAGIGDPAEEGTAAGQSPTDHRAGAGLEMILWGIAAGAAVKAAVTYFGLLRSTAEGAAVAGRRIWYGAADISPALLSVGWIVGPAVASQIFLGGAIAWIVAVPLLAAAPEGDASAVEAAHAVWSTQVRYLGVGAMIVGGVASIWRVRGGLVAAAGEMTAALLARGHLPADPRERNLPSPMLLSLTAVCVALIVGIYYQLLHHSAVLTLLAALVMLVMSFFFAAVASYIVGLVGNSNSPVSGMTITAVLATGGLLLLAQWAGLFDAAALGPDAMAAVLGVAGVVCCVACTSGDVCNDLKTGRLVGASPRNQQWMQVLGVAAGSLVMAPVLIVLHEGSLKGDGGGIGGPEFPAPQAKLFAALAEGFFGDGQVPWLLVLVGGGIGLGLLAADRILAAAGIRYRLYVMPVAVGIYLPFGLSVPILLGGLIRGLLDRRGLGATAGGENRGVLLASGVIAGESLLGVLLGLLAYLNVPMLRLGENLAAGLAAATAVSPATWESMWNLLSLAVLLAFAVWMARKAAGSRTAG